MLPDHQMLRSDHSPWITLNNSSRGLGILPSRIVVQWHSWQKLRLAITWNRRFYGYFCSAPSHSCPGLSSSSRASWCFSWSISMVEVTLLPQMSQCHWFHRSSTAYFFSFPFLSFLLNIFQSNVTLHSIAWLDKFFLQILCVTGNDMRELDHSECSAFLVLVVQIKLSYASKRTTHPDYLWTCIWILFTRFS